MDLFILTVLAIVPLIGMAAALWGVDSRPSLVEPRFSDQVRPNI
jgi:hypothetical protein